MVENAGTESVFQEGRTGRVIVVPVREEDCPQLLGR
jgi:hypothetical protein